MEILSIGSQKQIKVDAVKGNWQLDQSTQSKILVMALAMAAEIERDLIRQRPTGSGRSKLDKHRPGIEALLKTGSTPRYIANRFHTTESNFSRWRKKHGLQ
jgi:DNA invertase Pin-like site-specific DNA recombinase